MYRGVVRVFEEATSGGSPKDPFPPASPVEKELGRVVQTLREGMDQFEQNIGTYHKQVATQTVSDTWFNAEAPLGYAVPRVFVRAVAEAIEQGVITYCHLLSTPDQREKGVMRVLQEVSDFIAAPRHLYFETFEAAPTWYDYAKINVFDCVTSNLLGSADLLPPVTRVIVPNVNIPLFESALVTDESVPHLPQVEISLLKFSEKDGDKNPVVAQSVTVPLELFTKSSSIHCVLEGGEERDISYRAVLVRRPLLDEVQPFTPFDSSSGTN